MLSNCKIFVISEILLKMRRVNAHVTCVEDTSIWNAHVTCVEDTSISFNLGKPCYNNGSNLMPFSANFRK